MKDTRAELSADKAILLEMLRANDSFAALDDAQLGTVVQQGWIQRAPAGVEFFAQGDRGDFAYMVLTGQVSVDVDTPRGRVTVARLGPGQLVGEIAAFASTLRTATVTSLTDVALLRIEQATIRRILAASPDTSMAIIASLGTRLQGLNGVIATLTHATQALAQGSFDSGMLEALREEASRFRHFAEVFDDMAREITNKRLLAQEMETAAEIQMSFLPTGIDAGPHAGSFRIAASMTPAKQVGGDFYDYFMLDEDQLIFLVGDVSGKGVPAALFMSVARTVLNTIARDGEDAGTVLARVNALLEEDNAEGMFVTLDYGRLDLKTGAFDYASGGHEEGYILRADGRLEKIDPGGPAVGLFSGRAFSTQRTTLTAGDTVVFATDGVTEAFNPRAEVFGTPRFESLLSTAQGLDADQLVARMLAEVAQFSEDHPQSDDLTCLAVTYLGS